MHLIHNSIYILSYHLPLNRALQVISPTRAHPYGHEYYVFGGVNQGDTHATPPPICTTIYCIHDNILLPLLTGESVAAIARFWCALCIVGCAVFEFISILGVPESAHSIVSQLCVYFLQQVRRVVCDHVCVCVFFMCDHPHRVRRCYQFLATMAAGRCSFPPERTVCNISIITHRRLSYVYYTYAKTRCSYIVWWIDVAKCYGKRCIYIFYIFLIWVRWFVSA